MEKLPHALVPVAVIPERKYALPLAEALMKAGLSLIEVTLRTECAMDAMADIRKEFPEMVIGAGTILDSKQIDPLLDLGVEFGVSPGLNPKVVEYAQSKNFTMVPGVMTPGEVEAAMSMGLKRLKFFPAEAAGGVKMLKALAGPYGHLGITFVPTGGINAEKAVEYWKLPVTEAVGGSWFVGKDLLINGKTDEITRLTKEALALHASL